jgi:hypothetical protein
MIDLETHLPTDRELIAIALTDWAQERKIWLGGSDHLVQRAQQLAEQEMNKCDAS